MSKHDWEEAAEILGLEIRETQTVFGVSGTPVLMTGTVSRLPVTVVYDGGGQGEPARTKLRVGFPPGPWDTGRLILRCSTGGDRVFRWLRRQRLARAIAEPSRGWRKFDTGDASFDAVFVATRGWSTDQPPGQETFAEDFLTETRRAALLDLEFEIGVDMNLVTGDSAEPYAYLLAWTPERASRAWITKRGQVMPACIATLVQGA